MEAVESDHISTPAVAVAAVPVVAAVIVRDVCPGIRHLPRDFCSGQRSSCGCVLASILPKDWQKAQELLWTFARLQSAKRKRPVTRSRAQGALDQPSLKQQRYIAELYKAPKAKKARTESSGKDEKKEKKVPGKRKARELQALSLALEAYTGIPRVRGKPRFDSTQSFQWFNDIFAPGSAKANTLAGFLFRSLVGHTTREFTDIEEKEVDETKGDSSESLTPAPESGDVGDTRPTKEVHHNGYLQVRDLAQMALVCKELGGTGKEEKAGPCTKEIEVRLRACFRFIDGCWALMPGHSW